MFVVCWICPEIGYKLAVWEAISPKNNKHALKISQFTSNQQLILKSEKMHQPNGAVWSDSSLSA